MATLGQSALTLADHAKRLKKDGNVDDIVELLEQTNEILLDMLWLEGNDGTGHKTTVRSGLPTGTWRKLNYGVQPEKSTTVQVKDSSGMLETYSKIDKALADLNGNTAEFRLSEDMAFLEGLNQTFCQTLIYGDTSVNPEKFTGFAPRYNDLSAENGVNIIDAGGTDSDNTSIYLVVMGQNTCHGFFPKGSEAGLKARDLGEDTASDGNGGEYQVYRTHYKWDCGLTLRDWRYVVRIANIKTGSLTKDASSGADIVDLMTQAIEKVPNINMGRPVFMCNRTISSFLRRQIKNSNNVQISMDEIAGKQVLSFDGIPVRRVEAILNTEAQVS